MFTTKSFIVLLIAVALLASCAPAATQPPSVSTATQPPAAVAATQPPAATVASQDPSSNFEGLSSGLDNATQARIRAVLSIIGEPNVDVYVNGLPAMNGGKPQQDIGVNQFSGWLYVAPGTYTVALVPHGETLADALFSPVAVNAVAGHRYTVAVMGQVKDNDVHLLVVDETAMEKDAGLNAGEHSNMVIVELNNIKGAPAIDELFDGKPGVTNIPYGGVKAGACNVDMGRDTTIVTGHPEIVLNDGDTYCDPGSSFFFPPNNDAPTGVGDGNVSQGTSELNVIDFLAGFSKHAMNIDGHAVTFNTLLKIIDMAGWRDQLINNGPYFFMAPTDEAFSTLSQADLDALLNDPLALTKLLNAHIVDGYYPWGSLSGIIYGHAHREVSNRLGDKLLFDEDNLNGAPIGPNYTVGNGNRLQIIYTLLPSK